MNLKKEIKYFIVKYLLTFPAYYILNLYAKIIRLRQPFSRVVIHFGSLEFLPEEMDSEEFEKNRLYVERKMIEEYEKEDQYWNKKGGLKASDS